MECRIPQYHVVRTRDDLKFFLSCRAANISKSPYCLNSKGSVVVEAKIVRDSVSCLVQDINSVGIPKIIQGKDSVLMRTMPIRLNKAS